jgi:hypothetical protein
LRICVADLGEPAARQSFPADVGADQRGVDVHDLALDNLRGDTGGDCLLEDPAEAHRTPALADARQARVVGQTLGETETRKPPDRQVDVCLAHELAIMDDAEQETG